MRRALAFLLAVTATVTPAARAGAGAADLRAQRAALLARIAELTDRAEQDEVAVVVAQARQAGADAALSRARTRLERRAIDAYLYGLGRAADNLAHPNVYLEAAFRQDQQAIDALRGARAAATRASAGAEGARDASRAATRELEADRQRLEGTIAHQEALDAQLQAAAAARKAAVAAQEAARRAAERPSATPSAVTFVDRFETDPTTIARHRKASASQQALMARWPFGPVTGVPAGLRATDQAITGIASWYGPGFDGRATASGAIYDQEGWTCASKELPLGTLLLVSENGRSVLLLVNDRGPYVDGWILDLSHAAEQALHHPGVGVVTAQVVTPE